MKRDTSMMREDRRNLRGELMMERRGRRIP